VRPDETLGDDESPPELEPRVRYALAVARSRGGAGSSLVAENLAVHSTQLGRTVALTDAVPSGAFLYAMLGVPFEVCWDEADVERDLRRHGQWRSEASQDPA
jgi:Mrp family chromosome partitioning ATPase